MSTNTILHSVKKVIFANKFDSRANFCVFFLAESSFSGLVLVLFISLFFFFKPYAVQVDSNFQSAWDEISTVSILMNPKEL